MPGWTFVCALPGVDAHDAVDTGDVSIVPTTDPRFSTEHLFRFEAVAKYLKQFRDMKRRPVPSLLVIRKSGRRLMRGDNLTFLRNAFALSVLLPARARRARHRFSGSGPMFSDAFDLPGIWMRRSGGGLLVETQAVLGSDTSRSFCGHPAATYPYGSDGKVEWDQPLLASLLTLYRAKRSGPHAEFRQRIERVLQMAFLAFRAPGISINSETEWGTSFALTVSAFECLANQGGSVTIDVVQRLLDDVPWSKKLRQRLAPYEHRSPHRRVKNGVFVPLQRMTRPVQVYARLYRVRNMVLHGQALENDRLEPGRRHKTWGPLHLEAAVVFRCFLLNTLAKNGFGTYLRSPRGAEWRRLSLEDALTQHVAAGTSHDLYYDALGRGTRARRS